MTTDDAIRKAVEIGQEHGTHAAGWFAPDGTDAGDHVAAARRLLEGIEDGDPEILDTLPRADLSGEWADGYTPAQLARDSGLIVTGDLDAAVNAYDVISDLCDAYEQGFGEAVETELVRTCQELLSD